MSSKKRSIIALFTGWLTLGLGASGTIHAADGTQAGSAYGTGTISGRVQNAVTGQYLNNARVAVKRTNHVTFTDETGTFRLVNVPSGTITLEAFYTDLDVFHTPVNVPSGGSIEQNIRLTSVARYDQNADVVKLDRFVVSYAKETDAQALAVNEQRFSPNIKNVVAADAFGDVVEGNVGEFLKFIPGVNIVMESAQANSVSVRGLADNTTSVTSDGLPAANASFGNSRTFEFKTLSMNNISRVELTKVPTPATPADSLGGSINMMSKSAFERNTAELRYRVMLSANRETLSFGEKPTTSLDTRRRRVLPGFDFNYIAPISSRFGIVINASSLNQYNPQTGIFTNYSASGTSTGATPAAPYLESVQVIDAPRFTARNTLSIKADWKITPFSMLSLSGASSLYSPSAGQYWWSISSGTNGTPAIAGGEPMTFGRDWVHGATGRGNVTFPGAQHFKKSDQVSNSGNLLYRYDNGVWKIEAGLGISRARSWVRSEQDGTFSALTISTLNPVRIVFEGIRRDLVPETIKAFGNDNQEVDLYDIGNYRLSGAASAETDVRDEVTSGYLNLRRRIASLSFPFSVQVGISERLQQRDRRGGAKSWTYAGLDGNTATLETPEPYLTRIYNRSPGYGIEKMPPWVSPYRAWQAFIANPTLFTKTPAQRVSDEVNRITGSLYIEEKVSAYHAQTEARLLNNRLNVLTGVRYERTRTTGLGPINDPSAAFLRNADGSFARNAAGQRIRRPEAGAAGSLEEVALTRVERGQSAKGGYDGYYPSLHLTYNVRENFLVRAAYARTYGRPNFVEIIPTTTVGEFDLDEEALADPEAVRGTITLRNPNLRPWSANNYDLSLEYYTDSGGVFSAGLFLNDIEDFFGNRVWIASASDVDSLGLDPRYIGWNLTTRVNSGDARITGAEFNVNQSLKNLGRWGMNWSLFANATKLKLEGNQRADFSGFMPESMNWGATFRRRAFMAMAKWNYRGRTKSAAFPTLGPDAFNYEKPRTTLDMNAEYQLRSWATLFIAVSNVLNVPQTPMRYGSQTPDYARQYRIRDYGTQFNIGVKGTF